MAVCPKCGQAVTADAAYCSKCGVALSGDWSPAPATGSSSLVPPPPPASAPTTPPGSTPNTVLVTFIALVVVVLVLGVVVCGGAVLFFAAGTRGGGGAGGAGSIVPAPTPVIHGPGGAVTLPQPPPVVTPEAPPAAAAPDVPEPPATPVAPPKPDPVADRKVRLDLTVDCWDDQRKPFDVKKALVAQFKHAGIAVVEDATAPVDATIWVQYEEKEGEMYTFGGEDKERGTKIHYHLSVLPKPEVKPEAKPEAKPDNDSIWDLDQTNDAGFAPLIPQGESLYTVVLKEFLEDSEPFSCSGDLVSAALGRTTALTDLAPLLKTPALASYAVSALRAGGFKPPTPADGVRWSLAEQDFDAAEKAGAAVAVPVLIEFCKDRSGDEGYNEILATAYGSLAKLGGPEAVKYLSAQLHGIDRVKFPDQAQPNDFSVESTVGLIEAVTKLQIQAAGPDLTVLCNDPNEDIAEAAQKALPALGLPVPKLKPRPKPVDPDDADGGGDAPAPTPAPVAPAAPAQ